PHLVRETALVAPVSSIDLAVRSLPRNLFRQGLFEQTCGARSILIADRWLRGEVDEVEEYLRTGLIMFLLSPRYVNDVVKTHSSSRRGREVHAVERELNDLGKALMAFLKEKDRLTMPMSDVSAAPGQTTLDSLRKKELQLGRLLGEDVAALQLVGALSERTVGWSASNGGLNWKRRTPASSEGTSRQALPSSSSGARVRMLSGD
ncbi:unnamed protein product, partial [Amoebophrya sp. A25]